jgi:transcriptional regulator with XRE-family HTH domain
MIMFNPLDVQSSSDDGTEAIFERLRQTIIASQLDLASFARMSGIPFPSLRDYVYGRRKPGLAATVALLRFTGISADWLLLGQGAMYAHPLVSSDDNLLRGKVDRALLRQYLANEENYLEFEQPDYPAYVHWSSFALRVLELLSVWEHQAQYLQVLLDRGNPVALKLLGLEEPQGQVA